MNSKVLTRFRIWIHCLGIILVGALVLFGCIQMTNITNQQKSRMYYFYQLDKNILDVMNMGTSHVHSSISPAQWYNEGGIASYNLCEGSQAIWYSYSYLKEGLKLQSPKLIVLDVYFAQWLDDEKMIPVAKKNLLSMQWSINKWEALETSQTTEKEDLFWIFPVFHKEYQNIGKDDFMPDWSLGYASGPEREQYDIVDVSDVTESEPITEKSEEYFRKFIETCKEKNIELLLVNAPWPEVDVESQKRFNYIGEIAKEYELPFINGCILKNEIGIDDTMDYRHTGHLNYSGGSKWSRYLMQYIEENYDLPDRRGDKQYELWEKSYQNLQNIFLEIYLGESENVNEYISKLYNQENTIEVLSLKGEYKSDNIKEAVFQWGISEEEYETGGVFIKEFGELIYSSVYDEQSCTYFEWGTDTLAVERTDDLTVIYEKKAIDDIVQNGVNILVINGISHIIIDHVGYENVPETIG